MRKRDVAMILAAVAVALGVGLGVYFYSAIPTAGWGLSFREPGLPPVGNAGADQLARFDARYRDVTEEASKYNGKTVRFKGQVAMLRRDKNNMFAPGRFVMTCCADDIQFCGVPCKWAESKSLKPRAWVTVTATVAAENHSLYQGELGPVLTAIKVEPAAPAEQDVATF